jgi:hypothetical protein
VPTRWKQVNDARSKRAAAKSRLVVARKAARRQSTMDAAAASSRRAVEDRPPARDAAPCSGRPSLRELVLGPCNRRTSGELHLSTERTMWAPSGLTVTEEDGTEERTLFGVRQADMVPMLRFLAPQLASAFGHKFAPRKVDGERCSRGGSIITTGMESSSGPHKDETDSLLLCVSGVRMVWYAKPCVL